jgi:hypothetical protein
MLRILFFLGVFCIFFYAYINVLQKERWDGSVTTWYSGEELLFSTLNTLACHAAFRLPRKNETTFTILKVNKDFYIELTPINNNKLLFFVKPGSIRFYREVAVIMPDF